MEGLDLTKENHFHSIVIGGGAAAVTASIYNFRNDYKTIMLGKSYGGDTAITHLIENFPSFMGSGFDLMEKFREHYEHFNIPFKFEEVVNIKRSEENEKIYEVITSGGEKYYAPTIIVGTGGENRKLGVPGEAELHGRGVSYCATCDGMFFRGQEVIVVGGSDSAAVEALFLSQPCNKVYIVYRRETIRAEPINANRVYANDKIEIINNTNIVKINGENGQVVSVDFDTGKSLNCSAVFVAIGSVPNTSFLKEIGVELNQSGEIIVDKYARTNVDGIYAAGDVTDSREKQTIVACGNATVASYSAREYILDLNL